jgi:hypothetical protein
LSRGYYESISDLGTKNNYVITPNSRTVTTKEGVVIISLGEFLKGDYI